MVDGGRKFGRAHSFLIMKLAPMVLAVCITNLPWTYLPAIKYASAHCLLSLVALWQRLLVRR